MFTPAASSGADASKASAAPAQASAKQEETKTAASSGTPQINVNYDWYQNMTHVFVAYKIKQGGSTLAEGGLTVNMTEASIVLENSSTGEILSSLELSNPIDPAASTWTCSAKRIDIKLKKMTDDMQWRGLEQSASGSAAAIPAQASSGPKPSYPSSSKVKRDWSALDKDIDKELADDKPEGDAALNGLFK
mmetsp:Transcript_1420/g.1932  ORF Transcript_1420/g.1932 Transcript_1420/m.1932 type:complete len:191 (+) Transcript_1420:490-1062(+)